MYEEIQQKLGAQDVRIDQLSDSVKQSQKTAQDNAEMLQTILVGMENLGENFKQLQENMDYWQMPENPNVEAEHQRLNEELLKEVPLSVPVTLGPMTENASPVISFPQVVTPVSSSSQAKNVPPPQGWSMNGPENVEWVTGTALSKPYPGAPTPPAALGFDLGQKGQDAQEKGQAPRVQTTIPKFIQMGSVTKVPNTGGEGQPRRITPIPISSGQFSPDEVKEGYSQVAKTIFGAKVADPAKTADSPASFSGANKPTIGETSISTQEAGRIRKDVHAVMHEQFAEGRAALRANLGLPNEESVNLDNAVPSESVIDLVSSSAIAASGNPKPRSTFGSPVTVASVNPSNMTVNSGNQSFATAAWKPKEPPCFFGRSTEDAHTWVSLVRNYLTFMSGSDSQQVAYTVTLFREAAHEWYMSFERRNRGPPRDWAGLVAALLDRFGSNIRSQEAQSQLMSISQGQRAVRDYASQFETLLGRLDSYDEGLMLNQFIWGLQPDLARSVSLHYPTSIAKAVSLAETTELAVKASRRPNWKLSTAGNQTKGPNQQNRGRGQWRGRGGSRGRI